MARISASRLSPPASRSASPRPAASGCLSQIPLQIGADARQRRHREVGQDELPAGELLIDAHIGRGGLQDDVGRDFGNGIVIGIAALRHPAPDEVLVQGVGRLTGREAARIMLKHGRGSIFFTGATASLRGGAGYAAFASAKAGLIAPDETTFAYLKGRPHAPEGAEWDAAMTYWKTLHSDADAVFDAEVDLDASQLSPYVTWGTNPGQGVPLGAEVPDPEIFPDEADRTAATKALEYMALKPGQKMRDIRVDTVFLGSCTNGRIEDLRAAAGVIKGHHVADDVRMLVVPGSARVRLQAESEGLDVIFKDAGAEWRAAGCSMCLGMNPDQLAPGERAASTSNRNFEGRQGKGGRTHLVSPLVAAATAVTGTLSSPADLSRSR